MKKMRAWELLAASAISISNCRHSVWMNLSIEFQAISLLIDKVAALIDILYLWYEELSADSSARHLFFFYRRLNIVHLQNGL